MKIAVNENFKQSESSVEVTFVFSGNLSQNNLKPVYEIE